MASTLNADNGSLSGSSGLKGSGDASGVLALQTNGTTALTIDTSQNVGIGTSSPTVPLQVVSSIDAAAEILSQATNSGVNALGLVRVKANGSTYGGALFATNAAATAYATNSINLYAFDSQPLCFGTYNTERMRIDSSGNVGIGVTPSAWGANYRTLDIGYGSALTNPYSYTATWLSTNAYHNGTNFIYKNSAQATYYAQAAGVHYWSTAPFGTAGNTITFTQAMTLDSTGNLLVGASSGFGTSARLNVFANSGQTFTAAFDKNTATAAAIALSRPDDGTVAIFYRAWAGGGVGSISVTSSATTYATSSDYRLKENIAPMTGALAKVAQLKPVTYTWKSTGETSQGFIAHELQAVVPDCVTGEKDAVDEEGKPVYQGIDTSFLVATLTAAIQELKAEVDSLKAQLNK